ncbi:MAG: hypothetical protein KGI38_10115, partial [Thaumarchaeota archaeon]|nr:hypothetical protein [Nitrososphaerota archaeon]
MAAESEAWGRKSYTLEWVAPDKHVLIVNVDSDGINYGFYIGAVEGKDYGEEAFDVVKNGSGAYDPVVAAYFNHRFGKRSKRYWPQTFQYYLEHPTRPSPPNRLPEAWAPDIVNIVPLDK